MKRHARLWSLAAIVLVAGTYGCADHALEVTKPTVRAQASAAPGQPVTTERAALTTLTRAIALSLANDGLRAEVLQQMQSAPFKEHKLEVRRYLNPGTLVRTASAAGKRADDIAAALEIVRDLEFYIPVASQRESWTGDANILVASQLDDGEEIVAFDLKGRQVALNEASPPSLPTLALVPVETRFNEPLDPNKSGNINDRGGKSIGTMVRCDENPAACSSVSGNRGLEISKVIDCGECGGGGGSSYGTPGYYMTFSRIVDRGEPWTKGDPEIEVHVHGPVSGGNTQYGEDLSCSGEHAVVERIFDQNNAFWNGSVLIFTRDQVNGFNAEFPDGHHILFWEDDDTPCGLKFNSDTLMGALAATAAAVGGAAVKGGWPVGWGLILGSFLANAYNQLSWLRTNDDYLGALVPAQNHGDSWYDANSTLLKGSVVNGRANIISR
ncbi:MAG TPA: hypothetical protein VES88_00360 [Gemmatimonadaceae bacterium]|nr:hypothetical protein [Gemmatimonadaceae bacterium]